MNEDLGTVLGVRFQYTPAKYDGFVLKLINDETNETLFHRRMILYTLWEAVLLAGHEVWEDEIERESDEDLPIRIATALGIPETYDED